MIRNAHVVATFALLQLLCLTSTTLAGDLTALRAQANSGDVAAEYEWAEDNFAGTASLKVDYGVAAKWYEKAAAQGMAEAAVMAGEAYSLGGHGLAQNQRTARSWYARAADMGSCDGSIFLAVMEHAGNGGPVDIADAEKRLRAVSENPTGCSRNLISKSSDYVKKWNSNHIIENNSTLSSFISTQEPIQKIHTTQTSVPIIIVPTSIANISNQDNFIYWIIPALITFIALSAGILFFALKKIHGTPKIAGKTLDDVTREVIDAAQRSSATRQTAHRLHEPPPPKPIRPSRAPNLIIRTIILAATAWIGFTLYNRWHQPDPIKWAEIFILSIFGVLLCQINWNGYLRNFSSRVRESGKALLRNGFIAAAWAAPAAILLWYGLQFNNTYCQFEVIGGGLCALVAGFFAVGAVGGALWKALFD